MKAAFIGLFLLLICFGAGSVSAQSTSGQQKTVNLPDPTLKRMELQLKQQKSEIAELKRQLDERDGELHTLLKLLSAQYASPKHPERQEDPDANSSDNDDDQDGTCASTQYVQERRLHQPGGQRRFY